MMRFWATRTTLLAIAEQTSVEIVCGDEARGIDPGSTRAESPPSIMPRPIETPTFDIRSKGPERPPSGNDGP